MLVEMEYKGLRKVISGGQDGADRGGIEAAVSLGVSTGGWAPKGWRTASGPQPGLAKLGLQEHSSEGYQQRTKLNVKESDATLIIASNADSPGTRLTIQTCKKFNKPYLIVGGCLGDNMLNNISKWIVENHVEVLNVAGNRDYTLNGKHYQIAFKVIQHLIENLNKNRT